MLLHTLRRHLPRLGRDFALLFAVLWASVIATPCVMAMQGPSEPPPAHDCPHCPPTPCHEQAAPADCDAPEPVDRLRAVDASKLSIALPAPLADELPAAVSTRGSSPPVSVHSHAGPRRHLLHLRFDE